MNDGEINIPERMKWCRRTANSFGDYLYGGRKNVDDMSGHDGYPGGKSKFEELYYQYRKLMHWRAKQILNDDMLAEDAVHEAFIKIIRHMNKISEVKCNKTKCFVVIEYSYGHCQKKEKI